MNKTSRKRRKIKSKKRDIDIFLVSVLIAMVIVALLVISTPSSLTGHIIESAVSEDMKEGGVTIFKIKDMALGVCFRNETINITNTTAISKLVVAEDGFERESVSKSINFIVPEYVFEKYTGIDLILNVTDLDKEELEIVINGYKTITIGLEENYTGMKIIFIDKNYLLLGKNFILFINPKDKKCGLVLNNIELRVSQKQASKKNSSTDFIYLFSEKVSLMDCPEKTGKSITIGFNLVDYSFENNSGIELTIYAEDLDLQEIKVYLNGDFVGYLPSPENNYYGLAKMFIPNDNLVLGKNLIKIENPIGGGCGINIEMLTIKKKPRFVEEEYGVLFSDTDFEIGNRNCSSKAYVGNYKLDFDIKKTDLENISGIDIVMDVKFLYKNQLQVVVNGEDFGYINVDGSHAYEGRKVVYVPKTYLIAGTNSVMLVNSKWKTHCLKIKNLRIGFANKTESRLFGLKQASKEIEVLYSRKGWLKITGPMGTNISKSINFSIPFSVFKEYTGINIFIEIANDLDVNEIEMTVNGVNLGYITSVNNYRGAKKIFIPDKYLIVGENTITFSKTGTSTGSSFYNIEIVPALYGST